MRPSMDTKYLNGHARLGDASAPTAVHPKGGRKQRVTITLPVDLLERLRNAVYWTGHGPLARLIVDALDDAVTNMEQSNGQPFPQRLAPLKRGRPRLGPCPMTEGPTS